MNTSPNNIRPFQIAKCFATGFYSGYFPFAPGTAGSLVAIFLLAILYLNVPSLTTLEGKMLISALITLIAIVSASSFWKSEFQQKGNDDPQVIVIDEFAGCAITLLGARMDFIGFVAAFIFFRIFDILKPPPARQAENLPGGYGIVMDDVFAGIYAAICCWIFECLRN